MPSAKRPTGPFTPLDFQLVLLRRMADHNPDLVEDARHELGVSIAMGTDWLATGSMNMLRELRCADELNATYYDHYFTDESSVALATPITL